MIDEEFYALSDRNYEAQAARLVAEGWERTDWPGIIPSTFHKEVDGKARTLYLVTSFGDPTWWPKPLTGFYAEV